jgi:hypothetical protein
LLFTTLYSTSFIIILALAISITKVSSHLFTVSFTFVPAGHFIHDTTSSKVFSFVISLESTKVTISHHFNQAFSAGVHDIAETILNSQGVSISTYAHIHSYFQFKSSSKLLFSVGGK